jgi:hypothetical protein
MGKRFCVNAASGHLHALLGSDNPSAVVWTGSVPHALRLGSSVQCSEVGPWEGLDRESGDLTNG